MERRVNSSELGTESMLWDHEGVDDNVKLSSTHVSEWEKDQEFLEELEAPDPCEEYEDRAFSERVQKYLQKNLQKVPKQNQTKKMKFQKNNFRHSHHPSKNPGWRGKVLFDLKTSSKSNNPHENRGTLLQWLSIL